MESTRRVRSVAILLSSVLLTGGAFSGPAQSASLPAGRPAGPDVGASTLDPWHTAPSLVQLRSEINARWPNRSTASDGTLGDTRHRKSRNSHNPVGTKSGPEFGSPGAVHALDITADGIDTATVLGAVIGDPRVWYVIHDGRIWSRTHGWAPRRQIGDPHRTHIHISLRDSTQARAVAAETDTSRWLPAKRASKSGRGVSLSKSTTKRLQKALLKRGYRIPSGATGWYGPETTKAVKAFQSDQGWSGSAADGIAGRVTLARLGVSTDTPGNAAKAKKKAAKKKTSKKKAGKKASKSKTTKKKTGKKASKPKTSKTPKTSKRAAKNKAAKKKAAKKKTPSVYRPGNADAKIYVMQQALIARGYDIPAGPTGYFGERTVAAVRAFQLAQGWADADGIPGRATLRRLGLL